MIRVPFLDLAAGNAEVRTELDAAYTRVVDRGWFVLGDETERFEQELAGHCGVRHCIGVANGLDALVLALRARGIGAGDEVVVPSHTFIATWLAVTQVGATPVPVEVEERFYCLDPQRVEDAITTRTRAIIPVHLYGQAADMAPLREIAARRSLFLLEDAAQAHGATDRGRRAGALGDAATFSFYPGKNLGALGDGGAIVTDDDALAREARVLRNYGSERKYVHEKTGVNSRLDEMQAAFLRAKLPRLDEGNERRRSIAATYASGLRGAPGLRLPETRDGAEHVFHLYVVRHAQRDALRERLEANGIGTLIHYPVPCHRAGAYAGTPSAAASLPIADSLAASVLSLPMYPQLTGDQVRAVIDAVLEACASLAPNVPTSLLRER